jgi:hypothetical protein
MKMKQLIQELSELVAEHGDIDCYTLDTLSGSTMEIHHVLRYKPSEEGGWAVLVG